MTKEIKINKISSESFRAKRAFFEEKYKIKKKEIRLKYKEKLSKAKTTREKNIVKNNYKRYLTRISNKRTISNNALLAQRLYRKGVLEIKISNLKKKYKKDFKLKKEFDVSEEKKILKQKIIKLKQRYSKPVSRSYRKSRSTIVEKSKINFSKIKIPSYSPVKKIYKTILLIITAAILTTLGLDVFIKSFGLYNAGLRGITQIFYYIIRYFVNDAPTWYSHALFFGVNIPLAIWGWFKLSHKFTIYTILFLGVQYLFSLVLHYSGLLDEIKVFGYNADQITYQLTHNTATPFMKYGFIFISALIGSILYGMGVGLIYRAGGSTGGSKFIVSYISSTKNKSVGSIATIIGFCVITLGLLVNKIGFESQSIISTYTSTTLFGSIIFVFISNFVLDKVYNKNKKIELDVITEEKESLIYFLDLYLMFDKAYIVEKVKTGHSQDRKYKFEFIVNPSELKNLKKSFYSIDKRVIIIEKDINIISGKFYNSWFE